MFGSFLRPFRRRESAVATTGFTLLPLGDFKASDGAPIYSSITDEPLEREPAEFPRSQVSHVRSKV